MQDKFNMQELIEKATPKNIKYETERGEIVNKPTTFIRCKNCNKILFSERGNFDYIKLLLKDKMNYCMNCGQKLRYEFRIGE